MAHVEFSAKDKKKIQVVKQDIDPTAFDDKELPTDVHLITYSLDGHTVVDAVRAYTMVDIFDAYYDKLGKLNTVSEIKSGYGKIKPKLFGKINSEE